MQTGLSLGGEMKYAFDKKGHIRGVAGLTGNFFINWTEIATLGFVDTYRPTMGVVTLNLGGEYAFNTKEKIIPFLGAGFTFNFISGEHMISSTRYGFQLGFGADFVLGRRVGLVGGIKYNFANLIGKDSDTTKFSTNARELPLNDGEYVYQGQSIGAKNITFLQFYLGIEFIFGGKAAKETEIIK
jgi:hypothetical protein